MAEASNQILTLFRLITAVNSDCGGFTIAVPKLIACVLYIAITLNFPEASRHRVEVRVSTDILCQCLFVHKLHINNQLQFMWNVAIVLELCSVNYIRKLIRVIYVSIADFCLSTTNSNRPFYLWTSTCILSLLLL